MVESDQIIATGWFVGECVDEHQTRAMLCKPEVSTHDSFETLPLMFDQDIRDLLHQGKVPKFYGGPVFANFRGKVKGKMQLQSEKIVLDSIVYMELVNEGTNGYVSYVFRFDGKTFDQRGILDSLPPAPDSKMSGSVIRLRCRFLYFPSTTTWTITPVNSEQSVSIPSQFTDQLIACLQLDTSNGPDGPNTLVMSGTGVIEGVIQTDNQETTDFVIDPAVVSFEREKAIHRLWLAKTNFRWYLDEDLMERIL